MQNSTEQAFSRSKQQHSSRLLYSIIHTYAEEQNNQPSIAQSQATIHEINYEDIVSYRSNNTEKQQSRLIELIQKKESQLKTLESFLIKEFQQITQQKEKHAQIKINFQNLTNVLIELRNQAESFRRVCNQIQKIKNFTISQVWTLFEKLIQQKQFHQQLKEDNQQLIQRSSRAFQESRKLYEKQISHLKSVIDQKQEQIRQIKSVTVEQAHQIAKLTQELAQNPMANTAEPFKLDQQHLNKAIEKKESLRHLSEEELQVSFSADKSNKAKQLINAILHLKSNESLLNVKEDSYEIRASNKTVEEENKIHQGEQHRTLTGGFKGILLKGSTSSQSEHQNEISEKEEIKSPAGRSQCIQTSQVRRINSSANNVAYDASSAINKLDVFSELNHAEYSQDDDMSYFKEYEDQKYSEIEFRNMPKAKISRSMKAQRNLNYNNAKANEAEDSHSDIRFSGNTTHHNQEAIKISETKQATQKHQNLTKFHESSTSKKNYLQQAQMEESLHKKHLTPSKEQKSPKDSLESPKKNKKPHRYNYCRLYEEQQIKQIQNINSLCNHLIMNDKSNVHMTSPSRFSPFNSFDKVNKFAKQLTPSRKSRQPSPRKSSFSKLDSNRYDAAYDAQKYSKTFVRSGNQPISSFSNSKKPLTIQIPASPQRTQSSNERSLPNPYLKLENHLHQISCQQFSPSISRYMNEKTSFGYLDRSDHKSRTSYTDLRSEVRTENGRDNFMWDKKQISQQWVNQNSSQQQNKARKKQRERIGTNQEEQIISNNIDRKEYIKSKIEMIKKKNTIPNNPVSKSPTKISFLKSQQPQNYLSKQQLERPMALRQVPRNHNRSMYEPYEEQVKGYDFNQDKFEKEILEKSRRTDRNSHIQNSTISKIDKTKDISRVSYTFANNNFNTNNDKVERLGHHTKQNLNKSSSNVTLSQHQQYNDIYQQLNHNLDPQSQMSQQRIPVMQQSISKKTLSRPTQPLRQSVSPLRPTSRNTNTMYLPQNVNHDIKKQLLVTDNQTMEEKYNQDNLYKHPYMMDRRKTNDFKGIRKDDNVSSDNSQIFRRF